MNIFKVSYIMNNIKLSVILMLCVIALNTILHFGIDIICNKFSIDILLGVGILTCFIGPFVEEYSKRIAISLSIAWTYVFIFILVENMFYIFIFMENGITLYKGLLLRICPSIIHLIAMYIQSITYGDGKLLYGLWFAYLIHV